MIEKSSYELICSITFLGGTELLSNAASKVLVPSLHLRFSPTRASLVFELILSDSSLAFLSVASAGELLFVLSVSSSVEVSFFVVSASGTLTEAGLSSF